MKPILNPEQRRAVDCDRNAVAAAGAGSGKTSVLASRYVRLVKDGALRVDQILTLTFTRKAAAEMYRRIYGALRAEVQSPGGGGDSPVMQDRAAAPAGGQDPAAAALENFFHARIQTLDSYCAYIVRQAASRYGIRPDFRIDNEGARELAERESLPFLISRRHHPALERLYRGKRPVDIARGLFAASAFSYGYIDEPAAYIRGLISQFAAIRTEWEKITEILLPLADELVSLAAAGEGDDFLVQLRSPAEAYAKIRETLISGEELESYFEELLTLRETPGESADAAEIHPLRGRCLRWLKTISDLAYVNAARGKRNSRAKEISKELRGLFRVFSSILVYILQGGIILSVMVLLEEFQKLYVEKKRTQGILSFTDVARLARTIMRDQGDIRNNEKAAFKAVMIDEFQDNNSLQKELLFLLAEKQNYCAEGIPAAAGLEETKLFFVGDEKQSIYRFRGADVSVFRELKNELSAEKLSMGTNYRSSPQLIACFNALFGGSIYDPSGASPLFQYASIFPPSRIPPYEAEYSPLAAGIDEEGQAKLYILDSKDGGEDDDNEEEEGENFAAAENEAAFVAARIRELLDEKDEAGRKRRSPGDIAILLRTHRPQGLFEKHLRLLDIPYTGEGLSGFFADGPVNDMAAFIRLIAYPLDTEAYAISLRSPFAGLSLRGLALCIDAFNNPEFSGQPFSPPVSLDDEDRRAYERGGELYRRVRDTAAELSIGQLLSRLWYEEGYRYETIWNSRVASHRELFDYLYAQALKADEEGLSLAAFSDRLEALREREEPLEDTEIPLERPGAVRLLTIHKSKGLEFEVVFVVCCGSRARGRRNDRELYYSASGRGLSFNPPMPPECARLENLGRNFFYEEDRLEERRKETAELRRLLYVAMTRARRALYLSGAFPLEAKGGEILPALGEALEKKKKDRAKKNEEQGFQPLENDSILDNGTFFGLLLPAILESRPWLGEGGEKEEGKRPLYLEGGLPPYLGLELIPPLGPEGPEKREERGYANSPSGLARFFQDKLPLYTGGPVIDTPVLHGNRLSPSAAGELLGPAGDAVEQGPPFLHDPALSGQGAADIFAAVDPILSRSGAFAEFGSLAHLCVEAGLTGKEEHFPPGLAARLRPGEAETLLAAGKDLAGRFLSSPLGIQAGEAACHWSEYPFRSLWEVPGESGPPQPGESGGIFISGVIDLLYEWEDGLRVVDFKTDSEERPEEHLAQMSIYRRAAQELRGKNCRVWLYYLRSGRAVEIRRFEPLKKKAL
ncbi:MAG: UvrD-helicase domain-containing protein [Treponema sp.]|jgi:ATP-dependent helicase/nuclease subunit A|nr:UvrD-helicase domain-containing protein [Treponema sp.]